MPQATTAPARANSPTIPIANIKRKPGRPKDAAAGLPPLNSAAGRVLRARAAAQFLGVSIATLMRWKAIGQFIKPVRYSTRAVGYRLCDLEAFVASKMAG